MSNRPNKSGTLLIVFAIFILLYRLGNCSSCETPDACSAGNTEIQVADRDQGQTENNTVQNVSNRWTTWPNELVKHKMHSSLTLKDTSEVLKAFDDYHKKTCIRFQPWQEGDLDFVSIEVDENVCGFANVCKIGGRQVAKFGKDCRNVKTMIHQLGHTLCLGHEYQRPDRDQFLDFSGCSSSPLKVDSMKRPTNLYDYTSQLHSKCGLSVLDVDNLNYLYNCQGCQRHRWVPAASLSHEDYSNMPTFGYESENKNPIFACRAQHQTEIVSGMYDHASKTCKIILGTSHTKFRSFEILTILVASLAMTAACYKPVNWRNGLDPENSLVNVGNILYQPYWN
ncbi:Zinc metalloproteinase nas-1 [Orchesella cincta]|uniref:Metalloendopeptidase n=1 Tax=Orchesella cincta TaxID=48709 RepID=A0A1D2M3R4_ORCCI|nr:Zinc metalloproteinase nas-1 [Orchesella cincta]